MEVAETVVNFKQVENELKMGLANAELNSNEAGNLPENLSPGKPTLDIGSPFIKLFCRIKNNVQFSILTKNISPSVKVKLQHFNEVKDTEVIVYKKALDQYGAEALPVEIVELINKYSNSALAPLVEYEIEKFRLMKAEVTLLLKDESKEEK